MRKSLLLLAAVITASCSPTAWMSQPGLPADLARSDPGTITGSWREVRRDGRCISSGYQLSIGYPSPFTFAAQKDCTATGGVLVPLGGDRFRIDRYTTGFATEGCGPWRPGPAVAPFNGSDVTLVRRGHRLFATGAGATVELDRMMIR